MPEVQERLQSPPMPVMRCMFGPMAMQTLKTAVELDIFSAVGNRPETAAAVAARLNANPRGVAMLLDALSGMDLLTRTASASEKGVATYELTDMARLYMLPQSDLYIGLYIRMNEEMDHFWTHLTETVRNGKPQTTINQQEKAEAFFPLLAEAIFPMNFMTAQALAQRLEAEKLPAGARVLDLAAGAAVWSIPLAQRNPGLQVDALDFPATLATTRRFVEKYGLADRYQYLSGDWREVTLAENAYDMVILGHILHSEGAEASEQILAKVFKALKPGGRLVIAEFIADGDRTGPLPVLLFGLLMYLMSESGCVFSEPQLAAMLEKQGYTHPERLPLPFYEQQESPIMVAQKIR